MDTAKCLRGVEVSQSINGKFVSFHLAPSPLIAKAIAIEDQ